jgi:competence protein ComEC
MDWWLFTFFLGAILSLFLPIVPALFQLFCLLLFVLLIFYYKPLRLSTGLVLGIVWVLFNAWLYQTNIPVNVTNLMLNKKTINIEGEILNLQTLINTKAKPSIKLKPLKLNVKVTHVNALPLKQHFIVRLSWKRPTEPLAQGQTVKVNVKLKPAHGLANLGGFNYQAWLKSKQIAATGYVTKSAVTKNITTDKNKLDNFQVKGDLSFRQLLFNQYQTILPKHHLAPLLLALAFGERSSFATVHWDTLTMTGTGHLIAISGLHIGLVASSSFYIVMLAVRLMPLILLMKVWPSCQYLQQYNIRYIAILLSMTLAFSYGYFAGFSLPTQRALMMLTLYWLTRLFAIHFSLIRWLLITLFFLVLIEPFSLFTASFWLSVYAVSIIFLTLWRFKVWLRKGSLVTQSVKGLILIQCSLTIMILPVTAFFFQQIPTIALFANILAVPLMSLISIPLTLLSVLFMSIENVLSLLFSYQSNYLISKTLMSLSLDSLDFMWRWLTLLTSMDHAVVELSVRNQLGLFISGVIIFCILFVAPSFSNSWLVIKPLLIQLVSNIKCIKIKLGLVFLSLLWGVIVAKPYFFSNKNIDANQSVRFISQINSGSDSAIKQPRYRTKSTESLYLEKSKALTNIDWQLVMFDVGQGLSVLIQRGERGILYDTGASYPSGFNISDAVILPYLQYVNIKQLDKVILSHSDNDHAGGIKQLAEGVTIKELVMNDQRIASYANLEQLNDNVICNQERSFKWQGLYFEFLWPKKTNNASKQRNDDSCVVLVSSGKTKVLLTGDISKKVERQIINHYPELKANIIIVPHHGSSTSSSDNFLRHLSPDIALVSAGFINRWKMPTSEVLTRYADHDISVITTAESGQVIISFSDGDMKVKTYRQYFRPFWFSN